MSELTSYVLAHTERGACTCGKCINSPENPEQAQPIGHTADLVFFKVKSVDNPNSDTLRKLITSHRGDFNEVDLFDGKEHNYMEIGGWIGDQGLALMLMGLGELVGLWKLLTPRMLGVPEDMAQMMAGAGMISIQYTV